MKAFTIVPSRARVPRCSMASQAWVAERAIPLLKKKPSMGPKVVQEELHDKVQNRDSISDCCLWQTKGSQQVV